jgi:hypothetical protein
MFGQLYFHYYRVIPWKSFRNNESLGLKILNIVEVVVKVLKIMNIESIQFLFDQDDELNSNSKLWGGEDNIMAIIFHWVIPLDNKSSCNF